MELSRANGVSGNEREAVLTAQKLLTPLVQKTEIDALGNLVGIRLSRRKNAKTVLLDAHLDQVGLMVTGQKEGALTISGSVGGVDTRMLPGRLVMVLTNPPRYGVISYEKKETGRDRPIPIDDLRIDCGLTQQQASEILPGTRVAYGTEPWQMGDRIFGKSLDNRACFTALLRALELTKEEELPINVVVLGSVQEECGGAGALTAAFRLQPDAALVTDVTFGDSPDSPKERTFPLGSGVAVGFSPVLDHGLSKRLCEIAQREQILHSREIMENGTGTNSMQTQIAGEGIPSALISVPVRYMHTPIEVVDQRDIEAAARLAAAFLKAEQERKP